MFTEYGHGHGHQGDGGEVSGALTVLCQPQHHRITVRVTYDPAVKSRRHATKQLLGQRPPIPPPILLQDCVFLTELTTW